jgi:GAF domain-containing protein
MEQSILQRMHKVLDNLMRTPAGSGDLSSVLRHIVQVAHDGLGADVSVIFSSNPSISKFTGLYAYEGDLHAGRDLLYKDPESEKVTQQVLKEDMLLIQDLEISPEFQNRFTRQEGFRAFAGLAIRSRHRERLLGVMYLNYRQAREFSSTDAEHFKMFVTQAALLLQETWLEYHLGEFGTLSLRRVRELEILQQIDRELSRDLDLNTVLNTILRLGKEQVPAADEACILLFDSRTQILQTATAIGSYAEASQKQKFLLDEAKSITLWVVKERKPVRVDNVHKDPKWRDLYVPIVADTISELDVPLLDGDEVVGILNFESRKEGAFQQEDQDFLLTLAEQAVLAIKNAQAYEREKRLAEEGQVLNQISKEITSQLDHTRVFDLILAKALELTHSTLGSLHVYNADAREIVRVAQQGRAEERKDERQTLGMGVVGRVAAQKKLLNIPEVTLSPWNEWYIEFTQGTRSELAVPMLVGDELWGVLNIESRTAHNFNERDERLLLELADLAVISMQNVHAFEREKRQAEEHQVLNDIGKELTGQPNYIRVFDLILKRTLELTNCALGALLLYDPNRNNLWITSERGLGEDKRNMRISLNQGIVGYVARNKKIINVEDVLLPPWNNMYIPLFPDTRSELAVPLLAGDQLHGVLNVESNTSHHFKERDVRLLQGLANLAVVALQNWRDAQRFELLYRAGQELSKITDLAQLDEAYDIVLKIAKEQSQSVVLLRRFDKDAQELELIRASQPEYQALYRKTKVNIGINGQVARERRTIITDDIKNPPPNRATPNPSSPETRSQLVTPVLFEERYYGNLTLNHRDVGHFQNADIQFFEGLAWQLASTIHRLETVQARQEFERRALASEEMSSIGQSAFAITHRLGNDLGLIDPYVTSIQSELEKLGVSSAYISKKLDDILHTVKPLLSLSISLKQGLARMHSKEETSGEPVAISPKALLEEAAAVPFSQSNISICLHADDDVAHVHVLRDLVNDILHNLVVNAVHALPFGGTITLRTHNEDRYYVALKVSDTGVGIPEHKLPKIFDLFFSTKGSSGFGLWSARRYALKNRGDLKVESQLGQGTTFILLLPRADLNLS